MGRVLMTDASAAVWGSGLSAGAPDTVGDLVAMVVSAARGTDDRR